MKVRKKPEEYDAIQYDGDNLEECIEFSKPYGYKIYLSYSSFEWLRVNTASCGPTNICIGDYLYKDESGWIEAIDEEGFKEAFDIIEE
jgi:hypothetical protein